MKHEHESSKQISYTCSMHPSVIKDKLGVCPICGMTLVPIKHKEMEHSEHEEHRFNKHEGHTTEMFVKRFWISLILTLPVLFYSKLFQNFRVPINNFHF